MILGNRYRVVRPIKSGGMGAVYLAEDQHLGGALCAVKAILERVKTDPFFLRKFQNECDLLSQLRHPGIPRVRDFFVEQETVYLVMDYVAGDNLELNGGEPRPVEEVQEVGLAVLEILAYLHGLPTPVIHCDIKPANLIREQGTGMIKLVDFGLARALPDSRTQTVAGTLGFSAMEQLQGHAEPRSDLYSLGVSLYYLLTGEVPTFLMVPSVLQSRPDTPSQLAQVVDAATRLEVDQRPASALAMRQALLTGKPACSGPPPVAQVPPPGWQDLRQSCSTLLRPGWPLLLLVGISLAWRLMEWTQAVGWLWLGIVVQLLWVTGYAGSILLERLHSGRPALPAWGNGLLHAGRGLLSLAWLIGLLVPCWLLGVLPCQWAWVQTQGNSGLTGLWAFLATAWSLLSLLWLGALALCAPWSWAMLMNTSSLPKSWRGLLQPSQRPELRGPCLRAAGWFWVWALLAGLLLEGPIWFLAPVPGLLAWLVGSDWLAALYQPSAVPQRPPAPKGSSLLTASLWVVGLALIWWQACYRPSLDPARLPFCARDRGVGLINGSGWVSQAPRWQAIQPFGEGDAPAPARQFGRWGYLRRDGSWQIEPTYQQAFPFAKEEPARVRQLEEYFYIDLQGRPIGSTRYLEARDFHQGLAAARSARGWGFLDRSGNWVVQPHYGSEPGPYWEGWMKVELHPPESALLQPPVLFVNPGGQRLSPQSFAQAGHFAEGLAPVQLANGWAWLDLQGKIGLSRYDELRPFSEGRAAFRQGDSWGFLDGRGNAVIAPRFSEVRDFHQGLAAFQRQGKWGFLDQQGEVWLEPVFDRVGDWQGQAALLKGGQELAYIDRKKRIFWKRVFFDGQQLDSAWSVLQP